MVTNEMIDDVLTTAFEGGSPWIDRIDVLNNEWHGGEYASDVPSRGGTLTIYHDGGEWGELTRAGIVRGMHRAARLTRSTVADWFERHDAIDADNAVQYAIFGELVYG